MFETGLRSLYMSESFMNQADKKKEVHARSRDAKEVYKGC